MKKPMLTLSTIVDRETINIESKKHPNGKIYELNSVWDLGPLEQAVLIDKQRSAAALNQRKRLTGAQKLQLRKLLCDIVMMIVRGLEPAVLAELDEARLSTLQLAWVHANQPKAAAPGNRKGRRAARSSTGSK